MNSFLGRDLSSKAANRNSQMLFGFEKQLQNETNMSPLTFGGGT